VHSEPVLITNAAGIVLVLVCCASVSFMGWFFVALRRESRRHCGRNRLRVIVKVTDLEPLEGFEDSVPQYLATTIRMPARAARRQTADQKAIEIATAGRRIGWERRIP
jgi:hypothetical protein